MYLEQLKLMDEFDQWEYKAKLFKLKIRNIAVWEYIRYDIFRILEKRCLGIKTITPRSCMQIDYTIDTFFKQFKNVIRAKNPFIFEQKDILIMNVSRRQKINGVYRSPFIDDLIKGIKKTYCIIEPRNINDRDINILTPNIKFFDPISLITRSKLSDTEKSQINQLIRRIEEKFKLKLDKSEIKAITEDIISVISNRNNFRIYYRFILKQIKPKVIIVLGATLQYNRYLIELAKEYKIPTVELAHGWPMSCIESYYYKPIELKTYPDYSLTYSEMVKQGVKLPIDENNIIPVGSEYHNQRVKESLRVKKIKSNKINILLISDFTIESSIAELAKDLSDELDLTKYSITFKLHPNEINWRNKYPILLDSQVKVVGIDDKNDIYYYLADSDIVIGSASTVLYEATAYPIKIIIYQQGLYYASKCLYENGYAQKAPTVKGVISIINESNDSKDVVNNIFESNPIYKFNLAVSEIIKKCSKE